MVFTNHDLFEACVAARVPGMTYEIYAQVWDAMCRWIHYTVDECGHGVNMPQFIKITWAGSQYKDKDTTARDSVASAASSPAKKGPGFNPYVRRPHVLLHEAFLEQYNVRFRRPAELPMAKCEDLNCIKVAIKYGQTNGPQKLTKDLVSSALKRIVSKMGEMFQAGTDLEISFAVICLHINIPVAYTTTPYSTKPHPPRSSMNKQGTPQHAHSRLAAASIYCYTSAHITYYYRYVLTPLYRWGDSLVAMAREPS